MKTMTAIEVTMQQKRTSNTDCKTVRFFFSNINLCFRDDDYTKPNGYHKTKISKLLNLIEKMSFAAMKNSDLQIFLIKYLNEERIKLLVNQITS